MLVQQQMGKERQGKRIHWLWHFKHEFIATPKKTKKNSALIFMSQRFMQKNLFVELVFSFSCIHSSLISFTDTEGKNWDNK